MNDKKIGRLKKQKLKEKKMGILNCNRKQRQKPDYFNVLQIYNKYMEQRAIKKINRLKQELYIHSKLYRFKPFQAESENKMYICVSVKNRTNNV